ncbi:MAG TPA: hypothetical protein VK915_09005 [Gaiellaceae bacterium]|nr:hypothetical protein [Gaiellaceae bacterium]
MHTKRRITVRTAFAAAGLAALALAAGTAAAAPAGLDRTFGENGRVRIDSGVSEDVYDVALQPDGKILAAGWTAEGNNAVVYRLRRNGTLDPRFGGGDGVAMIASSAEEWVAAIAAQPDGKIVVAGHTSIGNNSVVYRLGPSGKLDPTFGGDGRVELDGGGDEYAFDVALQPDGRILVAGRTSVGSDATVYRLKPNGDPDPTFDGDGAVRLDSGASEGAYAVAVQPDGKIVVAGDTSGGENAVVYRLKPNGDPDPAFDGDGVIELDSGGDEEAYAVALQPDGKIVVAGRTSIGYDATVYRLRSNGSHDPTFDGDGTVAIDAGGVERASAVAIQANGKIVASGQTTNSAAAFRLTGNGSPDPSFGENGVRTLKADDLSDAEAVVLQRDGRIVLGGWRYDPDDDDPVIVRLKGDPVPTCAGRYATIVGTKRGDRITGTPGRDVLAGLGGSDTIRGLAGDDRLCGGKGDDHLYGGPGNDRLYGGPGFDRFFGGPGKDIVNQ